jgi:hemerythrin-like domain-containing protein
MPVSLGGQREHGFDQPLGLLSDCHRRIEHFLAILQRVREDCRGHALDDEHRRAVQAALAYFESAAPRHTEDEEQSLFPRLRRARDPRGAGAMQILASLESDHGTAGALHDQAARAFREWLARDTLPEAEAARLDDALARLREIYGRHIEVEDREVFPLAGSVLSPAELEEVGHEMRARRGLA